MVALFDAEKYAEALSAVEKFLEGNEGLSMAWRFKAECLGKLARYADAVPCYEKAIAIGGKGGGGEALLLKATAEWNAGKHDAARATLHGMMEAAEGTWDENLLERAGKILGLMMSSLPPK